jgi:CheY-like chemotaxis protein
MVAGLPGRAEELRDAARRMSSDDPAPTDDARRLAHRIAGIAGSHGFHALTEQGRAAERLIDELEPLERIRGAIEALAASCEAVHRDPAAHHSSLPVPRRRASAARPSVLAVEDDEATAQLLALTLGRIGSYAPTVVDSAEAALALLERRSFDLVLVDAMLPGMNGLEFTRHVRKGTSLNRGVAIVVLSAASPQDLGWDLGAEGPLAPDGWLRKPIRARSLLEDIEPFVRREKADTP